MSQSLAESVDKEKPGKIKISKTKVKEIKVREGKNVYMNDNFEKQSYSQFEDSQNNVSNTRYK